MYYYLSLNICGERGYIGSNLDSFRDRLVDLVKKNNINICITFNHSENIIQKTNKYFFEKIIEILVENSIRVVISQIQ